MIAGGCRAAAEPAGCSSWCRLPRRGCGPGSGAGGGTTDADQLRQRRRGRGGLIRAAPTIPHNSPVRGRIHQPDLRHANLARSGRYCANCCSTAPARLIANCGGGPAWSATGDVSRHRRIRR